MTNHEHINTIDINAEFDTIIDHERTIDSAAFKSNLEKLDAMPSAVERQLEKVSAGKMSGCQDTGGGGFEWEKLA